MTSATAWTNKKGRRLASLCCPVTCRQLDKFWHWQPAVPLCYLRSTLRSVEPPAGTSTSMPDFSGSANFVGSLTFSLGREAAIWAGSATAESSVDIGLKATETLYFPGRAPSPGLLV